MICYIFKDDPLTIKAKKKANPQKIGEALEALTAANKGHLTPTAVVEAARNEKHILHRHFEWDDKMAAESFRLDQARNLIRCVRIVDDTKPEAPYAFISISDKGGVSYRPLAEVMDSAHLQSLALEQIDKELASAEKRARTMTDICDAIAEARAKVRAHRAKNESRAQA